LAKFEPIIQFYAAPAEMATWICGWVQLHDLCYVFARLYCRGQPPALELLDQVVWSDPTAVECAVRNYSSVFLSPKKIETDVPTFNQISVVNRNVLRLELPNITYRGLSYCFWSTASEEPASVEKYRAIARDLKERTTEGVWFCQEGRKNVRIQPKMRYSPGAAALLEQGIPLCGGGRMVVGKLGLPQRRGTKRCT
jgi:hypothetical protein